MNDYFNKVKKKKKKKNTKFKKKKENFKLNNFFIHIKLKFE